MKQLASALLWLCVLATSHAPAAEAPAPANEIDMSPAVSNALNAIFGFMDAGELDQAATAMQELRAGPEPRSDYEMQVILQTLTNLAAQYLQRADWQKALGQLLVVNELQGGNDGQTLFQIAYSYSQTGQLPEAVRYMEQSVAVGGDQADATSYLNLAVLYLQAGNDTDAIATYEKTLTYTLAAEQREQALSNLAALYIKEGNKLAAVEKLQLLIQDYPNSSQRSTYQQSLSALTGSR